MEVEANETIADLKAKIKQLLVRTGHLPDGVPALLLRVGRVSGENVCNELPLSDYSIQMGDQLQVSWSDEELKMMKIEMIGPIEESNAN